MPLAAPLTQPDAAGILRGRRKMRMIANAANWIALSGIVLVVGYEAYLWLDADALRRSFRASGLDAGIDPTAASTSLAWLINLIPAGIFVAAMWNVRSVFALLASERIFNPALPRRLRRVGYLAVSAAVAGACARTLTYLVLSLHSPSNRPQLVIGIGSSEITSLVVGLLLFAFALVMHEALLIEEDSRSIV